MQRITQKQADEFAHRLFGQTTQFDEVGYYGNFGKCPGNHVIDYRVGSIQLNIYPEYGEGALGISKGFLKPFGYINIGLKTVAYIEFGINGFSLIENGEL